MNLNWSVLMAWIASLSVAVVVVALVLFVVAFVRAALKLGEPMVDGRGDE